MIIESLNEYLEIVAGYIYDNDKLVTYKWLSKELEVHVNIAKQVLWEFVQRHQGEEKLECTFLLIGMLPDGGMRVEVVKQENLDTAKKKFSKLISEHIYSLQKALRDISLLALAEDGDVKFSAIKCNESIERSEEEMHVLRWGALTKNVQPVSEDKSSVKPIAEVTTEKRQKSPEKKTTELKQTAQKKGFNSLFGKANNKQKNVVSTEEKKGSEILNKGKQTSPKQNGSISPKKKIQKSGMDCFLEQGKRQETINLAPTVKTNVADSAVKEKEKEKEKTSSEKNNVGKNNARGKKRNRSKDVKANVNKRKRITIKSDSSDAESSNVEEEEEQLPPSPEPEPVVAIHSPSPPKVKHEGGKRKVLKMVDKTFEEDGFLVTKKVHVYESCSEDEVEVEMKKSVTSESRPELKGKKNTKQTTLKSFFKKS